MNALVCMMMVLYFEAGNQSMEGQLAVGNVVLNRVERDYGDGVCDVVLAGKLNARGQYRRDACQFSFMCDGQKETLTDNRRLYKALIGATLLVGGAIPDITQGADHYHANYVNPWWSESFQYTTTVDDHIFLDASQ